jgi:predicted ATPase/transcriptional regulator with XRE-family HTH domain
VPFGAWLSQRRRELDLTQGDLARRIGCSQSTIKKIEEGKRRPSKQIAELLAGHLDIPPSERAAFVLLARAEAGSPASLHDGFGPNVNPLARASLDLDFLRRVHHPNNLPAPPNSFIGRDREVAAACALLRREGVRLLSMVGPPGIGKTRLSLRVASDVLDRFTDGVFFVALAPVTDPRMVIPAIAQALDVRETARRPLFESLVSFLRPKKLLLVLDNFEQVVPGAPVVGDLLSAAPGLKVLVTSRAVLHLYGEHELRIPPLALPDRKHLPPPEELSRYEAIALFLERARQVNPDLSVNGPNARPVADLCHLLEGLPLAIELAAARSRSYAPAFMLERLQEAEGKLKYLTGGPRNLPPRQRTIRGAIAWSYDLLDHHERRMFRRLSVFVGGCGLEAARAVLGGEEKIEERLDALVDNSLLRQERTDAESRYWMLETISEYGLERLVEAGEIDNARQLHAQYYLALAERAEPYLRGPEQAAWLGLLDTEHDNLRAALRYFEGLGQWDAALRLCGALGWFWFRRGYLSEGRERLSAVLAGTEQAAEGMTHPALARALLAAGRLAEHQGDNMAARSFYERSRAIYDMSGDNAGAAHALVGLAFVHYREGNRDEAGSLYEQTLRTFRGAGDRRGIAISLRGLGDVALQRGDHGEARDFYSESLDLFQQLGDKYSVATLLNGLGNVTLDQGDYAEARRLYDEGLAVFRELGYKYGVAGSLLSLAEAARCLGDYAAACALNEESLGLWRELGEKWNAAMTLHNLGHAVHHVGDVARAEAIFAESLSLFSEVRAKVGIAMCVAGLAGVSATRGDGERAVVLFGAADALLGATGGQLQAADLQDYEEGLAAAASRLERRAFDAAWSEGSSMQLEEVVGYALRRDA